MAERRRLPVLSNDPPKEDPPAPSDDERPPWHWAGFGAVAIFAVWVPLSYIGGAITSHLVAGVTPELMAEADAGERAKIMFLIASPALLALAIASFGGGYVVGRFGTGPGQRIAAVSGGAVALMAVFLARTLLTPSVLVISLVVVGLIACGFAAWGGRIGAKKRA